MYGLRYLCAEVSEEDYSVTERIRGSSCTGMLCHPVCGTGIEGEAGQTEVSAPERDRNLCSVSVDLRAGCRDAGDLFRRGRGHLCGRKPAESVHLFHLEMRRDGKF